MKDKISLWYKGTPVKRSRLTAKDDSGIQELSIEFGVRRHWTSKFAHIFVNFIYVHWQFLATSIIACVGIYVAYLALT